MPKKSKRKFKFEKRPRMTRNDQNKFEEKTKQNGLNMLHWPLQTYSLHPFPSCSPPPIFIWPVPILISIISWHLTSDWFWSMMSTSKRKEREGGVSPGVYKLVSISARSPELAVPLDRRSLSLLYTAIAPCSFQSPLPLPPPTVLLLLVMNFCTLPCGSPLSQPERRARSLQRRNDY